MVMVGSEVTERDRTSLAQVRLLEEEDINLPLF
jgi:hypothetical protein